MSRRRPTDCTIIFLLSVLLASPLAAQPWTRGPGAGPGPEADPTPACRRVVLGLMDALDTGDPDALRQYIYADHRVTAQQQGLAALIDCIVAQRELERAVVARWGAQGAGRVVASGSFFSPTDRTLIESASVEMNNERGGAIMLLSSGVAPIELRYSRFEGRWRVVLSTLRSLYDGFERNPEPGSLKRIGYMRAVAGALRRVSQLTSDGKLASPDDARAALQKAIESQIKPPQIPRASAASD
jgi:hypothetical protein